MTIDGSHACHPALVLTPFRYKDNLTVGRLCGFLGREGDCIIVRNYYVPVLKWSGSPPHASQLSVPTSKPIAPVIRVNLNQPGGLSVADIPPRTTRITHPIPL